MQRRRPLDSISQCCCCRRRRRRCRDDGTGCLGKETSSKHDRFSLDVAADARADDGRRGGHRSSAFQTGQNNQGSTHQCRRRETQRSFRWRRCSLTITSLAGFWCAEQVDFSVACANPAAGYEAVCNDSVGYDHCTLGCCFPAAMAWNQSTVHASDFQSAWAASENAAYLHFVCAKESSAIVEVKQRQPFSLQSILRQTSDGRQRQVTQQVRFKDQIELQLVTPMRFQGVNIHLQLHDLHMWHDKPWSLKHRTFCNHEAGKMRPSLPSMLLNDDLHQHATIVHCGEWLPFHRNPQQHREGDPLSDEAVLISPGLSCAHDVTACHASCRVSCQSSWDNVKDVTNTPFEVAKIRDTLHHSYPYFHLVNT